VIDFFLRVFIFSLRRSIECITIERSIERGIHDILSPVLTFLMHLSLFVIP